MANKKITDLQLISSVTDGLNVPGDNGIQSYRATALQFFQYIYGKFFGAATAAPEGADYISFFDSSAANVPKKATLATLLATGSLPNVQRFTSGSGTCTVTPGAKYLRVTLLGGGGGGAGSGTGTPGAGGNGGDTTFGTLTAGGGSGGPSALSTRTAGGANSGTLGTDLININGQSSGAGELNSGFPPGSAGSPGPFGGAGGAGVGGTWYGGDAEPNSGSGGGGAGSGGGGSNYSGAGGAAGAYRQVLITSPASSYSYAVGAGGTAGTQGGGTGQPGGAGGSGIIIVEEFFQ